MVWGYFNAATLHLNQVRQNNLSLSRIQILKLSSRGCYHISCQWLEVDTRLRGGQTNGGEKSSALTTDKHNSDHFVSPRYKDIHNEGHFVKDKYNFVISFGKHTETKTMRNILGTKTKVMKIILSHKHTKTNTIKTILSHKDKKTYNESHFVKGKHNYVIVSGKLTKTKTMWTICICIYALWSNCCISVFLSPELRE